MPDTITATLPRAIAKRLTKLLAVETAAYVAFPDGGTPECEAAHAAYHAALAALPINLHAPYIASLPPADADRARDILADLTPDAPTGDTLPAASLISAPAKPVAVPVAFARREAAILASIYPAANVKPRDLDYLAYHAYLARLGGGTFSVGDMLQHGINGGGSKRRNPLSAQPSAPAADAGAVKRAVDFGHIIRADDAPDGTVRYAINSVPDDATTAPAIALRNAIAAATKRADAYQPA